MVYLPRHMDEAHLERKFRSELESLRESVELRLTVLERPAATSQNLVASPNYIVNSHPEWSHKAWTQAGVAASDTADDNLRAYNWFFQEQTQIALSTSGTVTATQGPLIDVAHSAFTPPATAPNANAPIWDKINARFLMGYTGTAYDIACPLPKDFVFPGQRYYVYFETIATDDTFDVENAEFYCGFWDNTSTEQRWIQGSNFIPTYTIYGVGGTRTLKYKILAATDSGDEILSTEISVANAPNTMSTDNHVRLSFTGAPGFISFKIYRYDGIVYRLVGDVRNSIDLQFFDMQENAGSLETGWPDVPTNKPAAYKTTTGLLAVPNVYTAHTMIIQVPTTYDRSSTENNKQWFRFGLTAPVSAQRKLGIRRILVSEGYGPWVRSQLDLTEPLSGPSSTAASAPVPGGTSESGPQDGPDDRCVTLDALVETIEHRNGIDVITSIPIADVKVGMTLVCGTSVLPVLQIKKGVVQETYTIYTKRGFGVTCSASHRLIKSRFDKHGTAVRHLKVGDKLLTSEEGVLSQDVIDKIVVNIGETEVKTVSLPSPHLFVTNGLVSHNQKEKPTDPFPESGSQV